MVAEDEHILSNNGALDIHHHFYPLEYIDGLASLNGSTRVEQLTGKGVRLVTPDFQIDLAASFWEVGQHLEMMDSHDIKKAILSLANPWTEAVSPSDAPQLARITNDAIASLVAQFPTRFHGLATLPFSDSPAAVREARRSIKTLGLKGVIAGTHIHGQRLDSEIFWPIFEELQAMDAPLFIHPTVPPEIPKPNDLALIPILWFPFETTIAATRLLLGGVLNTFDRLKVILAHAGGALPYLMGRINWGHRVFEAAREHVPTLPSLWPKNVYLDTIGCSRETVEAALGVASSTRLLFGTDFPFRIADPERSQKIILELGIDRSAKRQILYENALSIFGLRDI